MRAALAARAAMRAAVLVAACVGLPAHAADAPLADSETFAGLSPRPIGPAVMSGRIAAIDVSLSASRPVYWVGSAGGGLWRSKDGAITFDPVFDAHGASIGAVAVDPSDSGTVWVGTGESWVRNSVSAGDGIYVTRNGGDTWTRMGLEKTERIARIVVNPRRRDEVFVAAPGPLWSSGGERGIFRTRDGGRTWENVLAVDVSTGGADVAMDPSDPAILYASTWQFRRTPWSFHSGGPGSGLWKSTDGGDTWRRIGVGAFPAGDLGRIAIAIAPSKPEVVYATVEAKSTALWRSDDRGATWKRMNDSFQITARPFYFSLLAVDPRDPNRVYKPGLSLATSDDGGKSFSSPFTSGGGGVHSDHHALWIDPRDPNHLVLGTDGGVYVSYDRGTAWRMVGTLPVAQFYHVSYDLERPYNVYGGLQDNGTWMGPSRAPGGIQARHWKVLGMGDGFWAFVDPREPDYVYVEYQGGNLSRVRRSTGETRDIRPYPREGEPELRFNWNTPIHMSPNQPGTVYFGSQYLLRSKDRGDTWERLSPDLTTNDPLKQKQHESGGLTPENTTAENHCTIFAIAESPKNADVIWAGTDDGHLQLTRDGGRTWTLASRRIPGVPKGAGVSSVCASPHAEGTAFVTFDAHGVGDPRPLAFATDDFGATWRALAGGEVTGWAHVIRQDPVRPRLVYLGTETGLWLSIDGGAGWARVTGGFPKVSVRDLAVHEREGDLLIATHGRGIWILDDLSALRALTPDVLAQDAAILPTRPSAMTTPASEQRFDGSADYVGQVPEESAFVTYYLKKRHLFGDLRLEVLDADGRRLGSVSGSKRRGLNRVAWPMRLKGPKLPPANSLVQSPYAMMGPRVAEGEYAVRLVRGKDTLQSTIRLVADARATHTPEDRALQQRTAMELYRDLERLTWLVDAIRDARAQGVARADSLPAGDPLGRRLRALSDRFETLRTSLVATREGGALAGERKLRERMGMLYGAVNGYGGRPTGSQIEYAARLRDELAARQREFEGLAAQLPQLTPALAKKNLPPIEALSEAAWRERADD